VRTSSSFSLNVFSLGSVKQLPNGNYMLSCGKRIVPRKGDPDQTASSKLFSDHSFCRSIDNPDTNDDKDDADEG